MGLQLQRILAAVDMSPASAAVVARAAMIAAKHGVALKLMDASALCEGAPAAPSFDLAAGARQAADRFHLQVEVLKERAASVAHIAREAGQQGLIVLPHEPRVRLRALWRGSVADQLLRICASPVLIIKSAAVAQERYQRVLVAVDLTPEAKGLVTIAGQLDDQSALQILHAIRPLHPNPLRNAEVPQRIMNAYLIRRKLEAHGQLLQVASAALKGHQRVQTVLREGEPARHAAVQQSHAKADLVVVGKRRCSALSDVLCCGVAKRLMAWCHGDILVVPLDGRLPAADVMATA